MPANITIVNINSDLHHYFIDSLHAQAYNYLIMNRLSNELRSQVIGALIEGNSIRSTCRMTGVCKDAVLKLIRDIGAACAEFHDSAVRGVSVQRVQCDEVWSFCYAKAKNVPEEKKGS